MMSRISQVNHFPERNPVLTGLRWREGEGLTHGEAK